MSSAVLTLLVEFCQVLIGETKISVGEDAWVMEPADVDASVVDDSVVDA